jgi:copper chaperone CopZ
MARAHAVLPLSLECGGGSAPVAERALEGIPGVLRVYANPATEMAYVEYDPERCDADRLRAALHEMGLGTGVGAPGPVRPRERRRADIGRIAVAAGVWAGTIYLIVVGIVLLFTGRAVAPLPGWAADVPRRSDFLVHALAIVSAGTFGGWLFAMLYNLVPRRRPGRRGDGVSHVGA